MLEAVIERGPEELRVNFVLDGCVIELLLVLAKELDDGTLEIDVAGLLLDELLTSVTTLLPLEELDCTVAWPLLEELIDGTLDGTLLRELDGTVEWVLEMLLDAVLEWLLEETVDGAFE